MHSKTYAYYIYTVIFLLLVFYMFVTFELQILNFSSNFILIAALTFTLYIAIRGFQWYSVDTTGEVITLETKRYDAFSFVSTNYKKIDLPKYKLNSFELKNGIINDDLTLFINSRKNKSNLLKVKFTISFLSKTERQELISKLNEIVEVNQIQLDSKIA